MVITSSDNQKIKDLKKLNERKYRDTLDLFVVEGEHLVQEAYKSGVLIELYLEEDTILNMDIPTTYVSHNVMCNITSLTTPTKVIGVCRKIESKANLGEKIIILDSIQDPGNLGTIIRSAVAFDVDTIILGNGSVDIYNPKVLRATQGLIFHINIIETNILDLIPHLKGDGYKIIGTSVIGGVEAKEYSSPTKWALIMGNEGHGLDIQTKKLCDDSLYIKMDDACESLNVSIACSIILYQLNKR